MEDNIETAASTESAPVEPTDTTASESTESLDFQGITPPSEQDLMGIFSEDTPEKSETKEEAQDGQQATAEETAPESTDTASSESKAAEGDNADEQATETEADTETEAKPPKGYVPIAAVHEARGEIRYLKEQIAALTEKVSKGTIEPPQPKEDPIPDEFKDFKELSPKELEEMVLEDPAEAILYTHKLQKYHTYRQTQDQIKRAAEEAKGREQQILNTAYGRMESAIPGLFDRESDVSSKLADFAKEIGFGTELFHLTDPTTKIIPPGQSEPVLFGESAAAIVEMLATVQKAYDAHQAASPEKIREQLTKEITETVQKDLLAKFKADSGKDSFTSLAAASGTDAGDTGFGSKTLTVEELAKLSPKQMEAYLSGM